MIVLFTDTDTDITPEVAKEYNARLISMPYIVDGKQIYPYRDWDTFKGKEFYDMLRSGVVPTTCAINQEEYKSYFEPVFKEGNDIFYVHFSGAMTATFEYMDEAVKELLEKYPDRKFYQFDVKAITLGAYFAVRDIFDYYKKTNDIEKTLEYANNQVDHYACYFFADDLKFFRKSGRVNGLSAMMGDLIGIKPIIHMNQKGVMTSIGKEKGRKKAVAKLVEYVCELGDHVEDYRVAIGHTDYLDLAKEFGEELNSKFDNKLNIEYVIVNPTAGSHCGPNGIGVSFHAIHR